MEASERLLGAVSSLTEVDGQTLRRQNSKFCFVYIAHEKCKYTSFNSKNGISVFRMGQTGKLLNFIWAAIYFFKAMSEQVDTKANCLCIMHSDAAVIISKILHGLESLELIHATGRLLDS